MGEDESHGAATSEIELKTQGVRQILPPVETTSSPTAWHFYRVTPVKSVPEFNEGDVDPKRIKVIDGHKYLINSSGHGELSDRLLTEFKRLYENEIDGMLRATPRATITIVAEQRGREDRIDINTSYSV
jgi:hypothetical protein